jgi:hypothetical protein
MTEGELGHVLDSTYAGTFASRDDGTFATPGSLTLFAAAPRTARGRQNPGGADADFDLLCYVPFLDPM